MQNRHQWGLSRYSRQRTESNEVKNLVLEYDLASLEEQRVSWATLWLLFASTLPQRIAIIIIGSLLRSPMCCCIVIGAHGFTQNFLHPFHRSERAIF